MTALDRILRRATTAAYRNARMLGYCPREAEWQAVEQRKFIERMAEQCQSERQ